MFLKEFEIRWSDIDANGHLANSAYTNLMSHARMSYLMHLGFDHKLMVQNKIGPVVFYEHMYYFKEIFLGKPIKVSVELMGLSKYGGFFEFHHNFYDSNGKNSAHCEMMGAWINLETRKLTVLTDELLLKFDQEEKPGGFHVLTKEDTRKFAKNPKDLMPPSL